MNNYKLLKTEMVNSDKYLDKMTTVDMLKTINEEDKKVAFAVEKAIESIANFVDNAVLKLKNGGRLFYLGAGTSGRLGVMDAAECPPTFGVDYDTIQGLMIGGHQAVFRAQEHVEDDPLAGIKALESVNFTYKDVCIGISASGTAQSVISALEYVNKLGGMSGCITCNENTILAQKAQFPMQAIVGPEVLSGSTRMKAGTSQKLILNMISTSIMVKLGRVKNNRMVFMKPTNKKLVDRAQRIVADILGISIDTSKELLERNDWCIDKAIKYYKEES